VQELVLGCCHRTSAFRQRCIKIASSPWFDNFVLVTILLNCLVLALYDPLDQTNSGWQNRLGDSTEWGFTIIFTLEMVVKLVALGLVGPRSYLSDGWNWIDGCVVLIA
jgi:voltage-dependent calcium channel L type alpha-1F